MTPGPTVVLDLFGVVAPLSTPEARAADSATLANALGVDLERVVTAFRDSWVTRQAGGCATIDDVAELLRRRVDAPEGRHDEVRAHLLAVAADRIRPTPRLLDTLQRMRTSGRTLVLCSDASPDIAEAWTTSAWAPLFELCLFSCETGRTKPDLSALRPVVDRVRTEGRGPVLFVGDGGGGELAAARRLGVHPVPVAPPNQGRPDDDARIADLLGSLCTVPAAARSHRG